MMTLMTKCSTCGCLVILDSNFCQNCEIKIQNKVIVEARNSSDEKYVRPALLTIVLAINYFEAIISGLMTFFILFFGIFAFTESGASNVFVLLLLTLPFPIIITVITIWLTHELQKYNYTAKIIIIGLNMLELIYLVFTFSITNIIGLILALFVLYVLIFDGETNRLFYLLSWLVKKDT